MEFSRQEYWSGLPFPSPGDLPNPGTEPGSPALEADALSSEPPEIFFIIEAFVSVLPQKNAIFFLNLSNYHILLILVLSGNMFSYLFI